MNDQYKAIGKQVVNVPYVLDEQVAHFKLASMGMAIDALTEEQKTYLTGWSEH
ncbi:S-adenosyl-L-homocysteine hydrolase [compost metagenome]